MTRKSQINGPGWGGHGVCPLIPLPFVDDMVQHFWERRMVRKLAEGHGLKIWEEEIRTLAQGPRKNVVAGIAKGVMLALFLVFGTQAEPKHVQAWEARWERGFEASGSEDRAGRNLRKAGPPGDPKSQTGESQDANDED